MAAQTTVHGFPLTYDENAEAGMRYLRDNLDYAEARVFFDQARSRGAAPFEDSQDRQFTLAYKNNAYTLTRR